MFLLLNSEWSIFLHGYAIMGIDTIVAPTPGETTFIREDDIIKRHPILPFGCGMDDISVV